MLQFKIVFEVHDDVCWSVPHFTLYFTSCGSWGCGCYWRMLVGCYPWKMLCPTWFRTLTVDQQFVPLSCKQMTNISPFNSHKFKWIARNARSETYFSAGPLSLATMLVAKHGAQVELLLLHSFYLTFLQCFVSGLASAYFLLDLSQRLLLLWGAHLELKQINCFECIFVPMWVSFLGIY